MLKVSESVPAVLSGTRAKRYKRCKTELLQKKIFSSHKNKNYAFKNILKIRNSVCTTNEMCDMKEAKAYTDKKSEAKLSFLVL